MLQSIIEQIFIESKSVCEKIRPSEKYKEFLDENVRLHKKIMAQLTEEQQKDFVAYIETHYNLECESSYNYFKEGVKFSFLFAVENMFD